jgi:hypothetical protein
LGVEVAAEVMEAREGGGEGFYAERQGRC